MGPEQMSGPGQGKGRTDWFARRRNHCIRRLVADFFSLVFSFQDLYGLYIDCHRAHPAGERELLCGETRAAREQIWNRLTGLIGTEREKGMLWQLKDLCHQVWPEQQYDAHGSLFDWLLGSLFHEAMKLKENIYLLNTYGPAAVRMNRTPDSSQVQRPLGAFPQLTDMVDAETLIRRIAADVVRQMEQMGYLLGQANLVLRLMMADLAGNMLVVRLLVEQEEQVGRIWGETVESLLADMFSGNAARGFCAAGRSYLAAQWYGQALDMYRRALRINAGCDEAQAKVAQLEIILRENRELCQWGSGNQGRGEKGLGNSTPWNEKRRGSVG